MKVKRGGFTLFSPIFIYGLYTAYLWLIYGLSMTYPWTSLSITASERHLLRSSPLLWPRQLLARASRSCPASVVVMSRLFLRVPNMIGAKEKTEGVYKSKPRSLR